MNWSGMRHSVLIAGGGQPSASTITGNHDPSLHVGTCQVVRLPRHHGEAETPTSNQPPRGTQGCRLLGPAALRTCPFASLLSQARACLGLGATVGILGMGVPKLAFLRPTAWLREWPSTAHLHQHILKTLARGQASRGG